MLDHVLESNPAHSVRGPRYSQTSGKTPVLEREEVRTLLASIGEDDVLDHDVLDLSDRAMVRAVEVSRRGSC